MKGVREQSAKIYRDNSQCCRIVPYISYLQGTNNYENPVYNAR